MPRYIDADAFFEDFAEIRDYEYASQDYEVDAVEVVRCWECKYLDTHNHRCKVWNHGVYVWFDFCGRAERREDETD